MQESTSSAAGVTNYQQMLLPTHFLLLLGTSLSTLPVKSLKFTPPLEGVLHNLSKGLLDKHTLKISQLQR